MAKIYVSSTFLDLKEHREQVERVLRRMGHVDVAMEYYTAENQRPVAKCLTDVAACDVYVGLFAWRYGWQPKESNLEEYSITEMEFRHAEKTGKPCLVFLLSEDAPWPRKHMDKDTAKIEQLRNTVSTRHTADYFTTPDELARKVAESIYRHIPSIIPIPEHNLQAYYGALRKRYGVIALEGLTPPQREEYLQIQLSSIFVEQNVRKNPPPVELPRAIWEKLLREGDLGATDLPPGVTRDALREAHDLYYGKPAQPVMDVLGDPSIQYVVILGDPGSGKSTLARYITLSLIDPTLSSASPCLHAWEGMLPLLIELRSYYALFADHKCQTFLEFVEYLGKTEGWGLKQSELHNRLRNEGQVIVIFDGLDEIFDSGQREQITRQIVGFTNDYPQARIIVTSRVIGYARQILADARFAHYTLQDLNEGQVAEFVNRWYDLALNNRPSEAKEKRDRIIRAYQESASIRELAGNPMLLTIMAIIGKHQELPRERWKLYDHAAGVLIEHWDVNRHLRNHIPDAEFIGEDDKKEFLRRLAFRMQGGAGGLAGNYIHREQLQSEFESYLIERYVQTPDRAIKIARAMIDQFRERDFILSRYGANLFGFVHRAFLEYFCASAFVHKFEKTQELTIDQLKQSVYDHAFDQSWREVIRLICGMIDERWAGQLIEYLIAKAGDVKEANDIQFQVVTAAAQCLGEISNIGALTKSVEKLTSSVLIIVKLEIDGIATKFDQFGGISVFVPHRERTTFLVKEVFIPLGLISLSLHQEGGLLREVQRVNFLQKALCLEAFRDFLGILGQKSDRFRQMVFDLTNQNDILVLANSILILAKYFTNESMVYPLLRKLALTHKDAEIRRTAIGTLGDYYRADSEVFDLVCARIIDDPSEIVRGGAVDVLAYWSTHPKAHDFWNRAKKDSVPWVCGRAKFYLKKFFNEE